MKIRSMLWAVFMFIACSANTVSAGAGSSDIKFAVHDRTYDEIWSAIERVAGQTLTIVDRNKLSGSLKATKGVLMGPWGDVVKFSIRPAHSGAAEYSVELASISQPGSRLPTKDWAKTMVGKIKSQLGQ